MSHGKTVVITGANSGIGLSTAKLLALKNYNLITLCRRKSEGEKTVSLLKEINHNIIAENYVVDLSDLEAVKTAANAITAKYPVIDRLVNNAGYYPSKIEYVNNIEKTLLASHLGHFLLTQLLMKSLIRSEEARVINLSSSLHSRGNTHRFFRQVNGHQFVQAYADAKTREYIIHVGARQETA